MDPIAEIERAGEPSTGRARLFAYAGPEHRPGLLGRLFR
jgi:hypothetical protein